MLVSYLFAVLYSMLLISQEPISSLFLLFYAVCEHLGCSVDMQASKACEGTHRISRANRCMNLYNPVQTQSSLAKMCDSAAFLTSTPWNLSFFRSRILCITS